MIVSHVNTTRARPNQTEQSRAEESTRVAQWSNGANSERAMPAYIATSTPAQKSQE
jgi:hypothetical protein